ncbi:Trichome birefringence-like, N-terminal domain [Dillenia turbinata]|uniref:Trichome birefringence-like, N-terminal domain n=1 Tax=Dillenia turbinata TaxID=194707 RepID=A0AAN8Z8N8_9MAGN
MAKLKQKYSTLLFSLFFIISLCFIHGCLAQSDIYDGSWLDDDEASGLTEEDDGVIMVQNRRANLKNCDFSAGKWVYDESYPLYDSSCPYLSVSVACQKNGRPDSDYERWKWMPHGCSIPRFNALDFLGRMRRKRIMLVGDSIMRNQWESLVCLVQGVVPTGRKRVTYDGPSMAFHAQDFEVSIEFFWAPLLVELKKGTNNKRILHLDMIEENAKYWRGADILVFDSAHWWTHSDEWSSWDYYMEGNNIYTNLNPMVAYEKGLSTWAKWVDLNLNPRETRVIFRSISPRHNRENGWKCYNQREPLGYFHQPHVPEQMLVLQGVLRRMRFPVYLQDITTMSSLRRDGHPSVYSKSMAQKEKEHQKDLSSDCSHWCLPGVPDSWNEMLNALF